MPSGTSLMKVDLLAYVDRFERNLRNFPVQPKHKHTVVQTSATEH